MRFLRLPVFTAFGAVVSEHRVAERCVGGPLPSLWPLPHSVVPLVLNRRGETGNASTSIVK